MSVLLLALLLVPSVAAAQPASVPPDPGPRRSTTLRDAEWSLVRPLPVVTIQVRRAAGLALLVPAFTLFTAYLFRPRPYVLSWVFAWLSASAMLLVLSFDSASMSDPRDTPAHLSTGRAAAMTWAGCAMLFGVLLFWGGRWFRAPALISPWAKWLALGLTTWLAVAATWLRPGAVILPAFGLMGLWQLRGSIAYLRVAREYRFVGALLIGVALFGLVAGNTLAFGVAITEGTIGQTSIRISYFNFVWAALMMLGMHLLVFEDVIEELRTAAAGLARGRDDMRAMAITDPLTRCYNRRFFDEIAPHELQHHHRYKLPLSIMYIDIDHFKAINDTRGHHVGDVVLQTLGGILRARTRKADYAFRWGGDEFLVLLSAGEAQTRAKAEEVRQAFLESPIVKDLPDGVDLSVGCTVVPPEAESIEPLIDQADKEMYRRKRAFTTGTADTSRAAGASALQTHPTQPPPPPDPHRA